MDLRYAGANSELTLPFPAHHPAEAALHEAFSTAHEQQYGYSSAEETIETMNLRVIARASTGAARVPDRVSLRSTKRRAQAARASCTSVREFGSLATPICARSDLDGNWRSGPLLVEEFDSTTVVPPDGRARCMAWDTIEIELARMTNID